MNSWSPPFETLTAEGIVSNLMFWTLWIILAMCWHLLIKGKGKNMTRLSVFLMCVGIPLIGVGIIWGVYWIWITFHSKYAMFTAYAGVLFSVGFLNDAASKV